MEPMQDPDQLVEYLESFYNTVSRGMDRSAYRFWTTKIRAELSDITDLGVRQRALKLCAQVEGGGYVLQRNPEMRESVVLPSIRRLIDCLKQSPPV